MQERKEKTKQVSFTVWQKKSFVVAVFFVAIAAILAIALWRGTGDSPTSLTQVDSFLDIHGLAIDPTNPRILYVATHRGLVRGMDDKDWALIGDYRADFMGFTMHPAGKVFFSSGHKVPDAPLMGVARSDDGGSTWKIIALRSQVDFHAMAISRANPSMLYGWYYRDGRLYKSLDGGHSWTNPAAEGLSNANALATDPASDRVVWAASEQGLYRSADGGNQFESAAFAGESVIAIAVDPADSNALYVWVTGRGLLKSTDGGASWQTIGSGLEVGPQDAVGYLAIDSTNPQRLYAATFGATLFKSLDGGQTWRLVKRG